MFKRFEVLFLFMLQCTPQAMTALAATPEKTPPQSTQQKVPTSKGDINLEQFEDVPSPEKRGVGDLVPKKTTCLDDQGNIIKKGETGFETCLANSQSRVLKPNSIPEAPDDGGEF